LQGTVNNNAVINNKLLIHIPSYADKESNSYFLQNNFLEWFAGFIGAALTKWGGGGVILI